MEKIPVTVDKSHLITIGERLYTENVELLRELVNNAYDADAEEVKITISENEVIVEDNGSGMDFEGLKQYFNIGSQFKRENPKSPKFHRIRIGEFGIGKFSVLSNCDQFEIFTKKGNFAGHVKFNKSDWEKEQESWYLPFQKENVNEDMSDGTKVILRGLKKQFDLEAVERRLIETLPLKSPNFTVYLNGKKLAPRLLTGRRIPVLEGTEYGIIHGEIVILPACKITYDEAGILVRVKQVSVCRLSFDLEPSLLSRITGEVNADFLPLTTDRNNFIHDSKEYEVFCKTMRKYINQAKEEVNRYSDEKENNRIKRALKEVTEKIEQALLKNRDWCPPGLIPVGESQGDDIASIKSDNRANKSSENKKTGTKPKKQKSIHPHLTKLTSSALIRKMKIGKMNLGFIIDHFGPDGQESFIEGEIIYINRDHPLYIRESRNRESHIMNITRLICKEISLMSNPKNPRHAFERQSKLLKDAFITEIINSEKKLTSQK